MAFSARYLSLVVRFLHTTINNRMNLKDVVKELESFAPSSLAASWDNVGLLIEPSGDKQVGKMFLTNDLTEAVMEEAIEVNADLILSYHPPIFRPLKKLTTNNWKERIAVACLENKIGETRKSLCV